MSTFKGQLKDPRIGFITIDYFKPETYECSAFLLSHVHWDHLHGIFDSQFISLINECADKFLYCSTFTAHLLTKFPKFGIKKKKIVPMNVNESLVIRNVNVETDIVLTCLAAGHCPGSVMFLVEYLGKRILYTGDFRIRVEELKKVKGRLTNEDGTVIPIEDLYLDTTFAFTSVLDDFPTRESSEKLIIDQIERWKWEIGSTLKILISLPYRYGIEYLYINLSKKFKKPISVHNYDSYAPVEEVAPHVISFEKAAHDDWLIHACMQKNKCPLSRAQDVKIIRPCAMNFLIKRSKASLNVDPKYGVPFDDGNIWRVFYSSHCSLKELQDVVEFLQPQRISPNVRNDKITEKEMIDLILKKNLKSDLARGDEDSKTVLRKEKSDLRTVRKRSREEKESHYLEILKKFKLRV